MKQRFLAFLLSILMILSCGAPLSLCVSAEGDEPAYPVLSAEDYNALYIQEGLLFAADFFAMNEYWGASPLEIPLAPAENKAYEYRKTIWTDANSNGQVDEGETTVDVTVHDFTVTANRLKYDTDNNPIGFSEAFVAACREYDVAVEAALNSFVHTKNPVNGDSEDPRYLSIASYLPSYGDKTYQDATGQYQQASFVFDAGYIRISKLMNNQYITIANIPGIGAYTAEYVGFGGTDGDFVTVRDVLIHSNVSDGVRIYDKITGYNGLTTTNLPGIRVSIASDAAYTLTVHTDRQDNEGTYTNTVTAHANGVEIAKDVAIVDSNGGSANTLFGYNTEAGRLYAIRYYSTPLSPVDIRYNHLIDLCKYFRLDAAPIVTLHENDLIYLADHMMEFALTDSRDEVLAAYNEAIDYLLRSSFTGSGDAYDVFAAAVAAGEIDAAQVRALTDAAVQAEIFAAYAAFVASTPSADAAAKQTALDTAIDTALRTHYPDYYGKTPALTAEQFFEGVTKSEAAKHFFEIAAKNAMDMTPLVNVDPAIRERVYESFADVIVEIPALTPVLADRLDKAIAELNAFYYGEAFVDKVVSFYGYQLKLWEDTGTRAVYILNEEIVADLEEKGYTVSVGILFRTGASSSGMLLEKSEGEYLPVNTSVIQKQVYTTGSEESDLFPIDGSTCFAYEHISAAYSTKMHFSAYVILEREGNEPLIAYNVAKADGVTSGPTMKNLASYCKDTLNYVAPNIQVLTAGRKKVADTSIYVDDKNLSEYAILDDGSHSDMIAAFNDAVHAVTGIRLSTVTEATEDQRLLSFATGEVASIAQEADGDLIFAYPADGVADVAAALAAALSDTADYGDEELSIPVAFLVSGQTFQ